MREFLRARARKAMEQAGIQHMNKPRYGINIKTRQLEKYPSYFAQNWKNYI